MQNVNENTYSKIKLFQNLAGIALVFAVIVGTLIIINYFQTRANSPIDSVALEQILERFDEDQENEILQNDVRYLDLLARKAYFTNQWQMRLGGILLIFGMVVFLISFRISNNLKQKLPIPDNLDEMPDSWLLNKRSVKWLAIAGVVIFIPSVVLGVITHNQIPGKALANKENISEVVQDEQTQQQDDNNATIQVVTNDTSSINDTIGQSNTGEDDEQESAEDEDAFPSIKDIYSNWPAFRGPGSLGVSYHTNIPEKWDGKTGENIAWKVAIPKPGYNSPVIWGDKLFLAGADASGQELYCINRFTGGFIWTKQVKGINGSPASPPSTTDDTGLSASSVTTDGKKVYVIFGTGDIACFDYDGKMIWGKNIRVPDNHYGHSSSLILYQNTLLVQLDDAKGGNLYGLSIKDGSEKWNTKRPVRTTWSSPILAPTGSAFEVILSSNPYVSSYNPEDGKLLWQVECLSGEVGPSCAYSSGITFGVNEYAKLVAISGGAILWENSDYLPEASSPVANDKYLFIGTSYGDFVCYDIKTGEAYWEQMYDDGFYSSPIIADGKVYISDMSGNTFVVKAENGYQLISKNSLGEKVSSTPATANGYIYIRGNKNLYGIVKK